MFLKIITLSSVACLIAGASLVAHPKKHSTSVVPNKSQHTHEHHAGYVKPGAAVEMTHDYDGQTTLSEFETVTLTLNHMYENGQLSVDILPTEGLQVFSNGPQQVQLHHGSTLNLPIQFSGSENGSYSIAVETVYENPEGQQSRRVLSFAVTIGTALPSKSRPIVSTTSKPKTLGVIALPATETIR